MAPRKIKEKKEEIKEQNIEKKEDIKEQNIEKKEDIKEQNIEKKEEIKEQNIEENRVEDTKEIYKREYKKEPPQKEQLSIIRSFLGKNITITLRSGNKLNGRLESISQYEIIITLSYKPVIIMKHAIDLIELTEK